MCVVSSAEKQASKRRLRRLSDQRQIRSDPGSIRPAMWETKTRPKQDEDKVWFHCEMLLRPMLA